MNKKRNSQSGLTLIEMLVSIGLTVILAAVIATFMQVQMKEFESEKIATTKISLQLQIERYLTDTNQKGFALYTLEAEPNLKNCVTAIAPCEQHADQGFILFDSTSTMIMGKSAAAPALFDNNGAPCSSGPRCAFAVYGSYSTLCRGNVASCEQGASVTVSYTIKHLNASTNKGAAIPDFVSSPIPIQMKVSKTPPFNVTSYSANGSLGVHQMCMLSGVRIGNCALSGAFGQNWILSGPSCAGAVCFDFL
jgi:type II secretory pathway pseudopilin PulG